MLPKLVGLTAAMDLILTGRRIDAKEAKNIGLVTHVYPVDEFDSKVEALRAEAEAFADLWNYSDLKEGIAAFGERRKPEFKGI